jgi:hypothetical protein
MLMFCTAGIGLGIREENLRAAAKRVETGAFARLGLGEARPARATVSIKKGVRVFLLPPLEERENLRLARHPTIRNSLPESEYSP